MILDEEDPTQTTDLQQTKEPPTLCLEERNPLNSPGATHRGPDDIIAELTRQLQMTQLSSSCVELRMMVDEEYHQHKRQQLIDIEHQRQCELQHKMMVMMMDPNYASQWGVYGPQGGSHGEVAMKNGGDCAGAMDPNNYAPQWQWDGYRPQWGSGSHDEAMNNGGDCASGTTSGDGGGWTASFYGL